jgi:hypothetical protein
MHLGSPSPILLTIIISLRRSLIIGGERESIRVPRTRDNTLIFDAGRFVMQIIKHRAVTSGEDR